MTDTRRTLWITEAATRLGVCKRSVYYYISRGLLTTTQVGQTQRVLVESVDLLKEQRRKRGKMAHDGKDWISEAALEIAAGFVFGAEVTNSARGIRSIIARHCPFKPGVAYEPVNLQTPARDVDLTTAIDGTSDTR